jgi:hypothetical protein
MTKKDIWDKNRLQKYSSFFLGNTKKNVIVILLSYKMTKKDIWDKNLASEIICISG